MSTEVYKRLSELDNEELEKVLDKNSKFEYEVIESMQEDNMYWIINEYLETLKSGLSDWSIGYGGYNFIKIKDFDSFVYAVEQMQKSYEFLYKRDEPEYYTNLITTLKRQIERLEKMESEKGYSALEEIIDENIQILKHDIERTFSKQLEYDGSDVLDYLVNFWLENVDTDNYYINADYELFQDVAYTKSYC